MKAFWRFLMGPFPFYFLGGWNLGTAIGEVVLGKYWMALFSGSVAVAMFYWGWRLAADRRARRSAERALGQAIMSSIEADAQRQKREVR